MINTKYVARNCRLCIFVFIITLIFTSCGAGLSDWSYDKLPNDYVLIHSNTQDIGLYKRNGESVTCKIDRYISEFCYNDSHIGIKRLMIDENMLIEEMDKSNQSYYLIDALNDVIMGPYTPEEYEGKIEALGIEAIGSWIKTVPKPEGVN